MTREEEKAINDTLEKLRLFEKMAKKIKREDVVQAALMVERYCWVHWKKCGECDCPFSDGLSCLWDIQPYDWELEEFLRTRGLDDGEV